MFTNGQDNARLITLLMGVVMVVVALNTEHYCRDTIAGPCYEKEVVYPWQK